MICLYCTNPKIERKRSRFLISRFMDLGTFSKFSSSLCVSAWAEAAVPLAKNLRRIATDSIFQPTFRDSTDERCSTPVMNDTGVRVARIGRL